MEEGSPNHEQKIIDSRLADWENQRFPDQDANYVGNNLRHSPLIRHNAGEDGFNDFKGTLEMTLHNLHNSKDYLIRIKDNLIEITQYWYTNVPFHMKEQIRVAKEEVERGDHHKRYLMNALMTQEIAEDYVRAIMNIESIIANME